MTDLELIFTMLGEASTTEIAKNTDAHGFEEKSTLASPHLANKMERLPPSFYLFHK
ncbi:MAG: hypothetical protein LBS22_04270 [Puniceicoccales bacterium]|jgi:hypothetical protein|nr:hypothetical protein [Puniceicoccales bacterium]